MTPRNKQPYEAVVFDLDGTLLDTLPSVYQCFGDAVKPFLGKRPSNKEIQDRFGPADHRIVADWVGPEHAQEAVEILYKAYDSALDTMLVFPGIQALLEALQERGIPLGLFTGRGRASTDWLLKERVLGGFFQATVSGDEVSSPKPSPEGLLQVLDQLGVSPGNAVYVGDSILDFRAAAQAPTDFIGVTWGTQVTRALEDAGARLVHDLPALGGVLLARD